MKNVRVRIAPSPTGYPHIGTIYQALFNYAIAKKHGGVFVVRIEDTDRTRFVTGAEEVIFQSLDWFGLTEDESARKGGEFAPYRSSERLEIYHKYVQELLDKDKAYYDFYKKEDVGVKSNSWEKKNDYKPNPRVTIQTKTDEDPPKTIQEMIKSGDWVVRMRVPKDQKISFHDEIRGGITFDSKQVSDQVILKSDGFPTYHLAVVVDDHLMEITHVVRGEEWISSTPKHVLLYEYFGWEKPRFYHTPDLRNPDKSKLSKRHGHTDVNWYKKEGYFPDAILNFLALMGWSHPEEKEIFSLDEFISLFNPKELKPVGPIFDLKKLEWINGEYIRKTQDEKLKSEIYSFYDKKYSEDLIGKTIPLVKERIKKLSDYYALCEFFFSEVATYEVDISGYKQLFQDLQAALSEKKEWTVESIGDSLLEFSERSGLKRSEFFMALRVAITGKKISPPLNESMEILGKDTILSKLKKLSHS